MLKFQEKVLFRKVPRLLSAPQIHSIYKFLKSWTIDIFFWGPGTELKIAKDSSCFRHPKCEGGGTGGGYPVGGEEFESHWSLSWPMGFGAVSGSRNSRNTYGTHRGVSLSPIFSPKIGDHINFGKESLGKLRGCLIDFVESFLYQSGGSIKTEIPRIQISK